MKKITIYFKNDASTGLQPETFTMEIPDFMSEWTETEEALNDYIEEKRKQIKELYTEFQGEPVTQVLFQWEVEELERQCCPIEEDTYNQILKEEEMEEWEKYEPSQIPKPGWVLCSDGLYRDLPY